MGMLRLLRVLTPKLIVSLPLCVLPFGCLVEGNGSGRQSTATTVQALVDAPVQARGEQPMAAERAEPAASNGEEHEAAEAAPDEGSEQEEDWNSDPDPEPWQPEAP
jgi:hypothetical protein